MAHASCALCRLVQSVLGPLTPAVEVCPLLASRVSQPFSERFKSCPAQALGLDGSGLNDTISGEELNMDALDAALNALPLLVKRTFEARGVPLALAADRFVKEGPSTKKAALGVWGQLREANMAEHAKGVQAAANAHLSHPSSLPAAEMSPPRARRRWTGSPSCRRCSGTPPPTPRCSPPPPTPPRPRTCRPLTAGRGGLWGTIT